LARIRTINTAELSPRQLKLHDELLRARQRDTLSGPFAVLIHTPDLAEPTDRLVDYFRQTPKLGRRLVELIILVVVGNAGAQYAWSVHAPTALKQGLTQETIDAIRAGREPSFVREDERLMYQLVKELLAAKTLSAATFERAKAAFGETGVIEAVTCTGLYGMIGLVLNGFEIPPRP